MAVEGAVGLAASAVALAGLFNNAVQCFEYVRLGKGIGESFQTCQLKLDNASLRLSRWGNSVGLSDGLSDGRVLRGSRDAGRTQKYLEHILKLFEDAESVSKKFKHRKKPDDKSLITFNAGKDLDSASAQLHNKMRDLSMKRQNGQSHYRFHQMTKWALYEEKHFRQLIEDLIGLINGLVELYPASQESQRAICTAEASAFGTNEALPILRQIAAQQDKLLEEALSKTASEDKISHTITFSGNNNSGFQLGHNSGTLSGFMFGKGN